MRKRNLVVEQATQRAIWRRRNYQKRWGLTYAEAQQLVRGLTPTPCAICHTTKMLCLDHCHTTGIVRGWLCSKCNLGLGYFRDSPQLLRTAANYLGRHPKMGQTVDPV